MAHMEFGTFDEVLMYQIQVYLPFTVTKDAPEQDRSFIINNTDLAMQDIFQVILYRAFQLQITTHFHSQLTQAMSVK